METRVLAESGGFEIIAVFLPAGTEYVYNFEFGPLNVRTGEVETSVRTKEGNYRVVLQRACDVIYEFLMQHPGCMVRFSGLDELRNRLFALWMAANWQLMTSRFFMYGYNSLQRWELYRKNGHYDAVLLKLKH